MLERPRWASISDSRDNVSRIAALKKLFISFYIRSNFICCFEDYLSLKIFIFKSYENDWGKRKPVVLALKWKFGGRDRSPEVPPHLRNICRFGDSDFYSIPLRWRTATFRIAAAYRIYIQPHVSRTMAKLVYQYLVGKRKRSKAEKLRQRIARGDIFL